MIVVREKLPQRANYVPRMLEISGTDLQIFCRLDGIDVRRPAIRPRPPSSSPIVSLTWVALVVGTRGLLAESQTEDLQI